jgi:hypothetical protein
VAMASASPPFGFLEVLILRHLQAAKPFRINTCGLAYKC